MGKRPLDSFVSFCWAHDIEADTIRQIKKRRNFLITNLSFS
jgi:hypothetical protein